MTAAVERRLYGNWVVQASSGIGRAGAVGTAILLVGGGLTAVSLMVGGFVPALIAGTLTLMVFAVTTRVFRSVGRWVGYMFGRARGEHQWRSGMFSRNNDQTRLPGMLGSVRLLARTDPFGVEFAVVKAPRRDGLYTIVAKCVADGPWMQDQSDVDQWVAAYAGVLAALGHEAGAVVCAKAITDTAPDPGGRLATMVTAGRADTAPAVARAVMEECLATYPAASSENVTYFEITFWGRALNRKGDEAKILTELSRRIPNILGRLQVAGGGAVSMLTPGELAGIVRTAYDPAVQQFLEEATIAGHTQPVTWDEAGPVAYQEFWDHLLHDSGRSVTWEVADAPRSAITERSLTGLLQPGPDFARKRVALVYRPHSPAAAARVSENDVDSATFNAGQGKKRIPARALMRIQATLKSRDEVATGAGLVRFSLLVTATVKAGAEGDLEQAVSVVEGSAEAVLMRLRRCYGSQAAGFAATLPIGFVPWEHTVVPDRIRELL